MERLPSDSTGGFLRNCSTGGAGLGLAICRLENKLFFEEYVLNYTNASFLVGEKFAFNDGVFSGFDLSRRSTTASSGTSRRTKAARPTRRWPIPAASSMC